MSNAPITQSNNHTNHSPGAGYKLTEVGVIPEDWEVVLLDSVAKRGSGHTPDKAHPEYWGGSIKWISLQDSNKLDRLYISDTAAKITAAGIANSSANLLPHDTVVMTRDAGVGKSAIMTESMAVSQHFMAWTCGRLLNNHYLYYWLQLSKPEFERIAMGNTIKTIGLPFFRQLRIPLPTKEEQEAIAAALSDADALIESLEQLIAKRRAVKQGAMQALLTGKTRLPGFSGEWEVKALGEIGEALIGLTYKPSDVRSNGVLVLRSSNVYDGTLRFDDNVFVEMDIPERIMVRSGDILVCVRNGSRDLIGKCAQIDEQAQGMTFGAFMAVFRPSSHEFVYHQFQSHLIKRQIHEHLGATINQITNKSLNSFKIPLPPTLAEQRAIASILSDIDAEIAALEAKLAKARQVKQGMMQELLTGRVRLV